MRNFVWILVVAGLTALCVWIVIGRWIQKNMLITVGISCLFVASNLGSVWMLYKAIRYERHPLPFILLACIPSAFLWYYFERVRSGKYMSRKSVVA